MKKYVLLFLSFCYTLTLLAQQKSNPLSQMVAKEFQNSKATTINLFSADHITKQQAAKVLPATLTYSILSIDAESLQTLKKLQPATLNMEIPLPAGGFAELQLVKADILTPDFSVVISSTGKPTFYKSGVFYRGIIKGHLNSLVALSFTETEISGVISDKIVGDMEIGNMNVKVGANVPLIIYDKKGLPPEATQMSCGVKDLPNTKEEVMQMQKSLAVSDKCVRWYVEADKDIYDTKGGVQQTTDFMLGIFNQVITVYENEQIKTKVSQLFVWTTTDPYTSTNAFVNLTTFKNTRPTFNGDLAQGFIKGNGSGLADGVDGPCGTAKHCFSDIPMSSSTYPTYSLPVFLGCHEGGHLMGSKHTHSCVWNGNSTAIDNCSGGPTDGNCSVGVTNAPVTIMSYCQISNILSNGFGPQPGNVIRAKYNACTNLVLCSTLPVNWLSITGNLNSNKLAVINFKVNENNVAKYEIEKSSNGSSFTGIATLSSKGDGENSYQFTESTVLEGLKYYRIKQVDIDGRFSYSSIIKLSAKANNTISIYPNPVKNMVSISGATVGSTVMLVDAIGKVLQQMIVTQSWFTIDMSKYSKGIYLLKTIDGAAQKIIKE